MLTLPEKYGTLIAAFAPMFTKHLWAHLQALLVGSILAPGQRAIAAVLRVMGLGGEVHFQNYHRVLSRAVWSSLALSPSAAGLVDQHVRCRWDPRHGLG